MISTSRFAQTLIACLAMASAALPAAAQTITVVGTPHLNHLDEPPSAEQLTHTVDALSVFEPTQVCVEWMSGERIEALSGDPARNAGIFRTFSSAETTVRKAGIQQRRLARLPGEAREEARDLVGRWGELGGRERARLIGLQLAGYDFPSALLNWSYLGEDERAEARERLGGDATEALETWLAHPGEISALAIPLARRAGLHELCGADSLEDEVRGVSIFREHGGQEAVQAPGARERIAELMQRTADAWNPEDGPAALTSTLRYYNSEEYAEMDRELQWETLYEFDNEAGALRRRLMHWHARTAEISAELFRALARGPEERVLFIVGAAHRPFTEADLRARRGSRFSPRSHFWTGSDRAVLARLRDPAEGRRGTGQLSCSAGSD